MTSLAPIEPDFDKRAQAEHYIALSGVIDTLMRTFTTMITSMTDGECSIDDVFDTAMLRDGLQALVVNTYAETFTPDELRAAVAFVASPHGKAILAKQRAIEETTKAAMPALVERCTR